MILQNISGLNIYVDDDTNDDIEILSLPSYVVPLRRQVYWTVLFALIVFGAFLGNAIVIWIILAHKNMRTMTNYFLVNLALAQMVAALNVPFNVSYLLVSHWSFGYVHCKVNEFIATVTISASVLTIIAISIDRYIAIVKPFKMRFGIQTIVLVILNIWILSFIISWPNWLYFTTRTQQMVDGRQRTICYAQWPSNKSGKRREYLYSLFFMFVTYCMPIIVTAIAYRRILTKLSQWPCTVENSKMEMGFVTARKKIVQTMVMVVIVFSICWLPYHLFFIMTKTPRKIIFSSNVQEIYLAVFWMAMSNSMFIPVIYCCVNSKFRNGFKKAFRWIPWINYKSGSPFNDEL